MSHELIFPAPSPDKIETMCKLLNIFFLKVFQGYVGYSFDNSGEFFRQSKIKFSFSIFKKLVIFFLFDKGFFLICSSWHFFFNFGIPEEKFLPQSHELQYSSDKPEIFNTIFQKQYSVKVPLYKQNLVLTS